MTDMTKVRLDAAMAVGRRDDGGPANRGSSLAMARGAMPAAGRRDDSAAAAGGAGSAGQQAAQASPSGDGAARSTPAQARGQEPAQARGGQNIETVLRDERARIAEIEAAARQFDLPDEMVARARNEGTSVDDFNRQVLRHMSSGQATATRTSDAMIGMSERDLQRFSIHRAVRYLIDPTSQSARQRAAFEIEASRAAAERLGRDPEGLTIPPDVIFDARYAQRAMTVGNAAQGGSLVPTDHLAGSFIDLLRNRTALIAAGATMLTGLSGNVSIPKLTGGATFTWVAEGGDATESTPATGAVTMTPHTVAGEVRVTRRLMAQSSPDIEAMLRNDLIQGLAVAIDSTGLNGHASANAPDGAKDVLDAGAILWAVDGAPTHAEIVSLETSVAADNADLGALAYIYNATTAGKLKSTLIAAGVPGFIEGTDGMVNGYRRIRSNNAANFEVFFGNWADFIIGMWSGADLRVDTATLAASDGLVLRVFQDLDFALRRAESFQMGKDNPAP